MPSSNMARVIIVDDDKTEASLIQDELAVVDIDGLQYTGPYPSLDEVISYITSQNFDAAILDHRLFRTHASFSGADLAARLYDKKFPALLITTFLEPYVRDAIRLHRRKVPVLLARNESDPVVLQKSLEKCRAEVRDGVFVHERIPRRVIIRVEELLVTGNMVVVIPSWQSGKHAIELPQMLLPSDIRSSVQAGSRLIGYVNVHAERADDLFFERLEIAGPPADIVGF